MIQIVKIIKIETIKSIKLASINEIFNLLGLFSSNMQIFTKEKLYKILILL